jgi:hypothetical protein
MKKTIFYITAVLLILSSCDPLADIKKEMNAQYTGYKTTVNYTLTTDDYTAVGNLATSSNATDATFIKGKKYFSDLVPAASYIPPFLAKKYPALSLGSSAMVTYNYNGALPTDLTKYTTPSAKDYTLVSADYISVDGVLKIAEYFSPGYAPEVYIPKVLASKITSPAVGDLSLVTYKYSTVDPIVDYANLVYTPIWQELFDGSLGKFTPYSQLGAQVWVSSSYTPDQFAKISGYSGSAKDNEDWLISAPISLTGVTNASLNFRHAANYLNSQWSQIQVLVSSNWDGTQAGIGTATWTALSGYTQPAGNNFVFVESGKISLASYANKTIFIAFKYLSTTTNAATWEIDRAEVVIPGDKPPIIGLASSTYKTFFQYTATGWVKAENLYYLNAVDYNAMGNPGPGKYDNFDATMPPINYLPALLKDKYPVAGQGFETVLVYKYYDGSTTLTLADKYKLDNGAWVSSYNFVQPRTSQFLYSADGWVFDPTVTFKMVAADYQIIVDWVKANHGSDITHIDSYGTQEFYTGAGSYYANFDLRAGKWDNTVFSTWEDAMKAAIGIALLPSKYPAAVAQVSGIDVNYIVSFVTYNGAYSNYTMKFQCTKSAPNPEFTLVQGPY